MPCVITSSELQVTQLCKWCNGYVSCLPASGFKISPSTVLVTGRKGFYAATFFQQIASLGNNLAIAIVAGQSMKVSLAG